MGKQPILFFQKIEGRISMIFALNCSNIRTDAVISTGVNSAIFEEFLTKLVTILGREGEFTIVMANLRLVAGRDGTLLGTNDLISRITEACTLVTQENLANYINNCEKNRKSQNEEDIGR
ncbi:hypothetical protein RF11_13777 [Thelohanellus kitauei]|uniref:Uncharacterized protein n=1 Tax=Thelohanellus kitauei TaxID=669202 RepID=A0A0C2MYR5_THEKT|nr:hypothetical protein RF11_13777 [Thelohanellus kitauei]